MSLKDLRPHQVKSLDGPEIWNPVVGYEGHYEVSNCGNVRSIPRQVTRMNRWGKLATYSLVGKALAKTTDDAGYGRLSVKLSKGGEAKTRLVHHLVLEAFVGPRPPGTEAAHWNGDASQNHLPNLRYATPRENTDDKSRHGTILRGSDIGNSKLAADEVLTIRAARGKRRCEDIAAEFGISIAQVSRIQTGKQWAHLEGGL